MFEGHPLIVTANCFGGTSTGVSLMIDVGPFTGWRREAFKEGDSWPAGD
jgi:hypothetical protein